MHDPGAPSGGAGAEVLFPTEVDVPWGDLDASASGLKSACSDVEASMNDVRNTWGGLESAYQQPETQETVHSAMDSVPDSVQDWADTMGSAGSALQDFATEGRPLQQVSESLRAQAWLLQGRLLVSRIDFLGIISDDETDEDSQLRQDIAQHNRDVSQFNADWRDLESRVAGRLEALHGSSGVDSDIPEASTSGSGTPSVVAAAGGEGFNSAIFAFMANQGDDETQEIGGVEYPPIPDDLTEEQRQQYIDDGILEELQEAYENGEISEEDHQQAVEDILALSIPVVDDTDGYEHAETIEQALTDESIVDEAVDIFGTSTEITEAVEWMDQNEINAADYGAATALAGSMSYLRAFHGQIWEKREDVQKYIEDGVRDERLILPDGWDELDPEQASQIQESWADGILTMSREDIPGGGWDYLPQELRDASQEIPEFEFSANWGSPTYSVGDNDSYVELAELLTHSDAQGGRDLSMNMAATAVTATGMAQHTELHSNGHMHIIPEEWNDALTADMLELAARNEEAAAGLMAGDGVGPQYYGNSHLDDGSDDTFRSVDINFNSVIFGHDWDDGLQEQVSGFYGWIPEAAASGDDQREEWAQVAFEGWAQALTDPQGAEPPTEPGEYPGTYAAMMDFEEGTAAQRNPILANALVDATAMHLDSFALQPGREAESSGLSEAERVRLFTIIGSADTAPGEVPPQLREDGEAESDQLNPAERMNGFSIAWQEEMAESWLESGADADHLSILGREVGKIDGYIDVGLQNAEVLAEAADVEAAYDRNEIRENGLNFFTQLASLGPGASGTAGDVIAHGLAEMVMEDPADYAVREEGADTSQTPLPGGVVTGLHVVSELVDSGEVEIEDLPDEIVNPGDYSDQYVEQEVRSFFEQQFGQYDAFDQFAGPIDEGYSNSHTERHFELEYGSDEERVREHLETADGNEGN